MNLNSYFPDSGEKPASFVDALRWQAQHQPAKNLVTFLKDGEVSEGSLTFEALDSQARSIGASLQQMGLKGQRAILFCPPGLDYISLFFGCLYGQVLPVPAYPPDPAQLEKTLPRVLGIIKDAQAGLILTTRAILESARPLAALAPDLGKLRWLDIESLAYGHEQQWQPFAAAPDDLAYLQYTSGSTLAPRGVMISHRNLFENSVVICGQFQISPQETSVIWLPPYHNMGLIAGILVHVIAGAPVVLMSPLAFLQNPFRWLKAMSDYRATRSGAPNFAFDLCAARITAEQKAQLDLSPWKLAFSGAEAVRADTLERFSRAFAPCGFHPQALIPAYGLAEATLMVSGGIRTKPVLTVRLERAALEQNRIVEAGPEHPGAQTFVGCGLPFPGQEVIIVDPETSEPLTADRIGEIWVRGDCVARGYWNRPEETAQLFEARLSGGEGPYLRTGDLGFLKDGELFIAGRLKDMIIIHGRNIYPQDVETILDLRCPGLPHGSNAAFSVMEDGDEYLVVVQEVDESIANPDELIRSMRAVITAEFGLPARAVVLIPRGGLPKTASGKIQRFACRDLYRAGKLNAVKADLLGQAAKAEPPAQQPPATADNFYRQMFLSLEPAVRQQLLVSQIQKELAAALKVAPEAIDPSVPLTALGIDSIQAVEMAHQIETTLGVPVPAALILQGISLAQLAACILEQMLGQPAAAAPDRKGPETTSETVYPLSYGQRAIWFLQSLEPDNVAYNLVYAFRAGPGFRIQWLEQAFNLLIARHPMLRATFNEHEGEAVQRILPTGKVTTTVLDAAGWSEEQVRQALREEVYTPFDLRKGPLIRLKVLENAPGGLIFSLAVHHIITDLWSMALFLYEVGPLYEEARTGTPANLKPVQELYTDYIQWQAGMVSGEDGQKHLEFWKSALAGDIPALSLPTDHPRPAVSSGRGAARSAKLDEELSRRLLAFAEARDVPSYLPVLAAFYVLLNRYSGQTDITVGFPKFNRDRKTARIFGYFINSAVLRADLSGSPTYSDLLAQLHQSTKAAFEHDSLPFPVIVEKLRPARDRSFSPLFQVIFSWQKTTRLADKAVTALAMGEDGVHFEYGSLSFDTIALPERGSPSDMALLMAESGTDIGLTVEYNLDLFDDTTIAGVLEHLQVLLDSAIREPEMLVAQLPLMSASEEKMVLERMNQAADIPWQERCLHEIFEAQAAARPDAVALVSGEQRLTYAELNRRANALAHYLKKLGAGPEVIIGIYAERSIELIVGLLGILKAGSVYLPLDPEYPMERLAYMIQDSRLPVLLTQEKFSAHLQGQPVRQICLDRDWMEIARESGENPAPAAASGNTAYIIYTSGTTGKPKGVQIPHGAAYNHCFDLAKFYEITPADRILQFSSPNFDASLEQIFTAFTGGAALYLRDAEIWPPADFSRKIHELGLTSVNVPPAYWHQWLQEDLRRGEPVQNPQLRLVIIGGDVLLVESLLLWLKTPMASARLLNAYGPTETTITSCIYEIPRNQEEARALARVPVGKPTPHRRAYLLDAQRNPVPIGVPGELYIGGGCLAAGYLNHPDLTAERFLSDPFGPQGARMYKTGDLALYLPDGNLEFLGRVDRQVKIRGFRIELEEIETLIQQYPGVAAVAVDVRSTPGSGPLLAAYLVPAQGVSIKTTDLHRFLQDQLPAYMLPAIYLSLDSLPLSPSGKIDRKALPDPDLSSLQAGHSYQAPCTPLEKEVAAMWSEVLGVEKVGLQDNFFDLGGHSLLATRLISSIRDNYHIELPLRRLFESPTVASLVLIITEQMARAEDSREMEQMLKDIEGLSDEEVARLLGGEDSSPA